MSQPQPHSPTLASDAICYNACRLAKDTDADALVGMTQSGYTGLPLAATGQGTYLYF